MATADVDVRDQIVAFKRALAPNRERLKRAFAEVKDHVSRAADRIRGDAAAGRPVVPELDYQAIRDGKVPETVRQSIREHRLRGGARRVPGRSRQRLVRAARRVSRDEPL